MLRFLDAIRGDLQLVHMSEEPLDLHGARPVPGILSKTIDDVEVFAKRGLPISMSALPAFIDAIRNLSGVGINDRKLLLEKILTLMSRLPDNDVLSTKLQQFFIDILYNDLSHPPSGYLSLPKPVSSVIARPSMPHVKYTFRSADGSNYNPIIPTLGKAGSPYARSVPSTNFVPKSALPDAGLVFDTFLRRKRFKSHPGGLSSFFFAFADLVIHSVFNTDQNDSTINNVSSYVDLSILYGSSDEAVDSVRRKDGTGMLWDDVFGDNRLRFMPPSVGALLILFNRNHNYIAQKILDINEWGTYSNPADQKRCIEQDDEIFNRARLVNCGFFVQVVLGDYVGGILGLSRDGNPWRLNLVQSFRELGHELSPLGQGNVVSLEFNLLYRWHACVSEQDVKSTEESFAQLFKGKDLSKLTPEEFLEGAAKGMIPPKDVREWTFGNLKRNKDGRFEDAALAKILQDATEWPAGAFGARGIPTVLRAVELLGIEQARSWGTCSLNEFRRFLGLRPYETFEEWNPEEEIYTAAEALYSDINNLELHVGLQAEETKKPMSGAGLCPGYTISRAILADATALTRGDRFLSANFTPFDLTSWGFQDCQYDKSDGSFGGILGKMLYRTLPDYYPADSAYAKFPFLVPSFLKDHLENLPDSHVHEYNWSRPPLPNGSITVSAYRDASTVLADKKAFRAAYDMKIYNITNGMELDKSIVQNFLFSEPRIRTSVHYFQHITGTLIKEKSATYAGSTFVYVDIVKDVINLLPIYWIADELFGLDMKTHSNPSGIYRYPELYEQFANVSNYVLMNLDVANDWTLCTRARKATDQFTEHVKEHLSRLSGCIHRLSEFVQSVIGSSGGNKNSDHFLAQLLEAEGSHPIAHIAASLFFEVVPTAAVYSKAIAHVVNFYLHDDRKEAREDIVQLSALRTLEADAKIQGYVREALRLDPIVSGVVSTAVTDTRLSDGREVHKDERVVVCVAEANSDKKNFGSDPIYNRPVHDAGILGVGRHGFLSENFFESTVATVLGAIFSLKGLTRGPGQSGKFNRFTQKSYLGFQDQVYINTQGQLSPWPASLVVQYVG